MRLYFEDPDGYRLALDTERHEWAATYANANTQISDNHFFVKVESPEVLYRIESEADFCGYGYNDSWIDELERRRQSQDVDVYESDDIPF